MLNKNDQKKLIILLSIIGIATFLILNYLNSGLVYHLVQGDSEEISRMIHAWGGLSEAFFVIIIILEVLLAPIPGIFLYTLGGITFGPVLGGILALIGNVIGAYIAFLIGRGVGRDYLKNKISTKSLDLFDSYSKKYGGFTLFLIRLNPLTSSDIFSYLAGFMKMKTWEFLLWTTAAIAPLIFLQTFFGEVILAFKPLYWIFLIIGLIYIIAIIFFTYFYQKKQ